MSKKPETVQDSSVSEDAPNQSKSNAIAFSFRELSTATNNFRQLIGEGGYGPVYKGRIESTGQIVAVKKLNHTSLQGNKEFLVEVLMLSLLRHPNLVDLVGYCDDGDQRILVYEFFPLGSLEYHLHDLTPDMQPLDWNTRMKVVAGIANGLNYLHHQAKPPVIYRDLKSSNVLMDNGFLPRLSDFGLAKFGPHEDKSHVTTRVMGTYGYCAPEYAETGHLTLKSDVYSFGIILLEIVTGLKALDETRVRGSQTLFEWARPRLNDRRNFLLLADPLLHGNFPKSKFCKIIELVLICVRENASSRPTMTEVVGAMNYFTQITI